MILFLKIALLILAFYASYELFRRGGFWLGLTMFCFLPCALTPWWIHNNPEIGIFPWVKLFSVLVALTWETFTRFTKLGRRTWWRHGIACLFLINIFEAILQDSSGQHLAHWLVVISGILMIITLPSFRRCIQIDLDSKQNDLVYSGMNRKWIVEYTVWNAAFVYLNFPQIVGHQIAVLTAAAIAGLIRPELWLQARGYTLGVSVMVLASFPQSLISWANTEHWSNPYRENMVSAACLVILLGYTIRFIQLQLKNYRNSKPLQIN
jgi:Family of unknown function (DUF5692)